MLCNKMKDALSPGLFKQKLVLVLRGMQTTIHGIFLLLNTPESNFISTQIVYPAEAPCFRKYSY